MKKHYDSPSVEIIEIQLEGTLCGSIDDGYKLDILDQDFGGDL